MKNRDEAYEDLQPNSFPYLGFVFLFLTGAAMGHCWWVSDFVALGTVFLFSLGSLAGYCCGFWRSAASTMGMFVGYQFAVPVSVQLVPFVEGQLHHSIQPAMGLAGSGFLAGIVATIVLLLVGVFLRRNAFFRRLDHSAGGITGLCSTVAGVALVFWVLLASEPKIQQSWEMVQKNESLSKSEDTRYKAIRCLTEFIDATKKSYVMVGLRSWNPFLDVAYLRDLKMQLESSVVPEQTNSGANSGLLSAASKLIQTSTPNQQRKAMAPDSIMNRE
jgi:uncharacterized membrane protein required for colicin V production